MRHDYKTNKPNIISAWKNKELQGITKGCNSSSKIELLKSSISLPKNIFMRKEEEKKKPKQTNNKDDPYEY